jgi:Ca-activated chloride channel family protein
MSELRQAEIVCGGDQSLMLLGVKANGAIKGRLLAMSLQQRFRNTSDTNTEITYTFPLPFGAVLMGVDVELNGKQLKGEVTAKSTARARYEEALSEGNSSIILERNPDHSYTLELGNLMAREECGITVRYAQVLQLDHGQVRLMLPTTIAPRYGNPVTQGGLQPHQAQVTDITAEYPFDISVTLYGDLARANVASPSHKTGYYPNGDELVVRLAQRGSLDRDFILTVSDLKNQSSAISCLDACLEGQTALMASFSPQLGDGTRKSVSAKILVDCSGSMGGDSISAARSALHSIVAGLEPSDKFSLSRFGSTVEHRSRGMWGGTSQAKASARRWIDNVDANLGGTEMAGALVSTIAIAHIGKSDILLITDGEIEGINEVIDVATQSGHRVFVVAIGASPAEAHLRRLAAATGGVCDFVAPGEDVEPAVLRMFSRMRAARASMLRVEWPSSMGIGWTQKVPGYAFGNDTLNLCAFASTPSAQADQQSIRLWGCLDDASTEVLLAEAEVSVVESTVNTLARVVAFSQYTVTAQAKEVMKIPGELSKAQELAVQYQLVTDETNFILVHERAESEKAQEMPTAHKVPQMLTAGWGGTGTVRRLAMGGGIKSNVTASVAGADYMVAQSTVRYSQKRSAHAAQAFDDLALPAVFRSVGKSAAGSVDALSMGGMDDYEIPAFLRKQADDGVNYSRRKNPGDQGIAPAAFSEWLSRKPQSAWPSTYSALRDIGLGLAICEWLEFEMGKGMNESVVVAAFIAVIQSLHFVSLQGLTNAVRTMKGVITSTKRPAVDAQLVADIRLGLNGIQASKWPAAVVDFPQGETVG